MSKEALAAANAYLDYWLGNAMFVSLEERRQKLAEAFDAFARPLMLEAYIEGSCSYGGAEKDAEEWVTRRLGK